MENLTLGKYDLYMSHLQADISKENNDTDDNDGRTVVNTKEESGGDMSRSDIDNSALADLINKGAINR